MKLKKMTFKYGIDHLTVDKVISISKGTLKAELTTEAIENVN